MASKLACALVAYCLFYFFVTINCSIVKPNNIPRIGRSDESAGPFDQNSMGYVIKTNKNIPRIGRRNYDSVNRYDIPKFYQMPGESYVQYGDDQLPEYSPVESLPYADRYENMKK